MEQRHFRRIAGFVAVWLQKLNLDEVVDLRSAKGKRWQLKSVLSACLLGLMSGCKSLAEVEQLTAKLSGPIRRRLGINRRMPDTTPHAATRPEQRVAATRTKCRAVSYPACAG